uniref:RING-type E3 ubiquitin transferase n=2 Tax=Rhizophora mucronata TaxID=61149 RepID=A0A2P2IZ71_RHIMU
MGNWGSGSRRGHPLPQPPAAGAMQGPPQPQLASNQYVNSNLHQTRQQYPSGYYPPPPPPPLPFPRGCHRYSSCNAATLPATSFVEHQQAVTITNDVNIKKESIRIVEDEDDPGKFLVAFTFDATASGSITVAFFAKERVDCNLMATKENVLKPVTVSFEQGLGQKFRQPSRTGINFSMFEETLLIKEHDEGVYPLVLKADACPPNCGSSEKLLKGNSQITLAVFDKKEKGEYLVHVMKQILWVGGIRYELQEIYGIGNSVGPESSGNDLGKECVICMSEPRDTTVLPCRHMCMCSECAKLLQFRTKRCPICRQPVERLLEIKVNDGSED